MADLSFEDEDFCFFSTTRTINSRLWFINNPKLVERILAYLAKYQETYGVVIYAFVLMGNHYHLLAKFPRKNKALFFRDFNGIVAKLVSRHVKEFEGGKLWARRVRSQVVPNPEDIKDRFFYAALNPVNAGIARKLSEYESYNSFQLALRDRQQTFKVVDWERYNSRRRFNVELTPKDFTREYTLRYSRLPTYEDLKKSDYVNKMLEELEARRRLLVQKRLTEGKGFAPRELLRKQQPGAKPKSTKTSTRGSHRPLVLTLCRETKERFLDWYFSLRNSYILASKTFRAGLLTAIFPAGTYRPSNYCSSSSY